MYKFGKALIKWRQSEGVNIYSAACCCGMQWSQYNEIEQGTNVTMKNVIKITQALKIRLSLGEGVIKLKSIKPHGKKR